MDKNSLYNSVFFPIAEISASISIGLLVWYGSNNVVQNLGISLGTIFLFIQMSQMLFRPLRQIADKFNTLQMGMVATHRVFEILETKNQIRDSGTITKKHLKGSVEFKNVEFSYVAERKSA